MSSKVVPLTKRAKPSVWNGLEEESRFVAAPADILFLVSIKRLPTLQGSFLPAAGYRNGTSLNNAGTNGNYWSSSLNTSNPNNAYNLNFNSDNHDWNNNNRYNGQSVRPVRQHSSILSFDD